MRKSFVAGNWKMNGQGEDAVTLARSVRDAVAGIDGVDVAICPPFTSLAMVAWGIGGSPIKIGGQDLFWRESGAFTGKISGGMLKTIGCTYVIVGHSECRGRFGKVDSDINEETIRQFGDSDATVNLKIHAAFKNGLLPIVCCGETLAERQAGKTDEIVGSQVRAALSGCSVDQVAQITIAYEPVWAIGTGQTCDTAEANRVCGLIRSVVGQVAGRVTADAIRIQYGGSVTSDNAAEILSQEHIDGALVGGQRLKPEAFAKIVKAGA